MVWWWWVGALYPTRLLCIFVCTSAKGISPIISPITLTRTRWLNVWSIIHYLWVAHLFGEQRQRRWSCSTMVTMVNNIHGYHTVCISFNYPSEFLCPLMSTKYGYVCSSDSMTTNSFSGWLLMLGAFLLFQFLRWKSFSGWLLMFGAFLLFPFLPWWSL